jgi:alkanesulfonate monooxygenase SsuD/methylene tetrahydromethanopterin reductase-like flavin-dependent oxidoreductase (luciferase family)
VQTHLGPPRAPVGREPGLSDDGLAIVGIRSRLAHAPESVHAGRSEASFFLNVSRESSRDAVQPPPDDPSEGIRPVTTDNGSFEFPRTGLVLPEYADRSSEWLVRFAREAEASGFESLWLGEGWGYSPFPLLGQIAERTDCTLGTCIVNAYARQPTALAANALALHDATDGRFVVGIGSSTPAIVENFFDQPFERPLRHIRETIEIVDLALSGDRIEYDGERFQLEGFVLNHAYDATVPFLNAALGRANIAMSIDHADGILPHLMSLSAIDDAVADARERANTGADLHVSPSIPTAIHEDPDEARSVLSAHLAYYLGSTEFYNRVIRSHGFEAEANAIREAWEAGDRSDAAAAVTPELQDALGIAGTPQHARTRVRELLDGPVDTALISFPQGATDEMFETTLEALPPDPE